MGGLFLVGFWQGGYREEVGSAANSLLLVLLMLPDNVGFCILSARDVSHGIMTDWGVCLVIVCDNGVSLGIPSSRVVSLGIISRIGGSFVFISNPRSTQRLLYQLRVFGGQEFYRFSFGASCPKKKNCIDESVCLIPSTGSFWVFILKPALQSLSGIHFYCIFLTTVLISFTHRWRCGFPAFRDPSSILVPCHLVAALTYID